jgi:plastocyanin
LLLAALVAVIGGSVGVGLALASSSSGGVTVKTFAADRLAINKYLQNGLQFKPGTITVKSGGTLTFAYGDREQEPHTLTIVAKAQLPKTVQQVENCGVCQRYASPHLKNPRAEPGPGNPVIHWTLNKGQPGLDVVGDSLVIQPGAHKTISAVVSAPAGTTLYFVCAVHPWMQGKIVVT